MDCIYRKIKCHIYNSWPVQGRFTVFTCKSGEQPYLLCANVLSCPTYLNRRWKIPETFTESAQHTHHALCTLTAAAGHCGQ